MGAGGVIFFLVIFVGFIFFIRWWFCERKHVNETQQQPATTTTVQSFQGVGNPIDRPQSTTNSSELEIPEAVVVSTIPEVEIPEAKVIWVSPQPSAPPLPDNYVVRNK